LRFLSRDLCTYPVLPMTTTYT